MLLVLFAVVASVQQVEDEVLMQVKNVHKNVLGYMDNTDLAEASNTVGIVQTPEKGKAKKRKISAAGGEGVAKEAPKEASTKKFLRLGKKQRKSLADDAAVKVEAAPEAAATTGKKKRKSLADDAAVIEAAPEAAATTPKAKKAKSPKSDTKTASKSSSKKKKKEKKKV